MRPLRIALLTHSTNPRGGVVHALELGDALTRLGHHAVVHAPDPCNAGFFRATICETLPLPAAPAPRDLAALVHTRTAEYRRHFAAPAQRDFDIFHAQDSISGNALAALRAAGLIAGFTRTVHHLDDFADPTLAALQRHAVTAAAVHFTVSRHWQSELAQNFGISAHLAGNGVDLARFSPIPQPEDRALRHRLGLGLGVGVGSGSGSGPVLLAVGGIEQRKNTILLLQAFAKLQASHPGAKLLIAGGASLLDHSAYQREFHATLSAARLPPNAVIVTGPLPQADMPSLYRSADALAFPSVKEGFGLAVLEAMASGLPVLTSRIAPFTEYLGPQDVIWCDPHDTISIASAMAKILKPARRPQLIANGARVAARHDWLTVAKTHAAIYAKRKDPAHA